MKRMIYVAEPALIGNEQKYVMDCLKTSWISSIGKYIPKFEKEFAKFCGVKYAVSCNNGTSALHLALLALGVSHGDEVIVPTLTYISVPNSVLYCGATPVFVDSEAGTGNIDPSKMEEKITKKTKAVIVVHLYGHPAKMDEIKRIAKKHKLYIIEDAAEAHGARYKGKSVGSLADIGTFSFFGNKIITTGEGGMVVANSKKIADKVRLFKGQGMSFKKRYWFIEVGYNYRMTNIQAAIGLAQLEKVKWHMKKRREVAGLYNTYLKDLQELITLPLERPNTKHAFWMYTILLKDPIKLSRDVVMRSLFKSGIETRPVFPLVHRMPAYKNLKEKDRYPMAEHISQKGISLPTHALLTEKDIVYIADTIKRACKVKT